LGDAAFGDAAFDAGPDDFSDDDGDDGLGAPRFRGGFDAVDGTSSGFFDDGFEAGGLVARERQVAKTHISFATKSKRVDVARLKADVWRFFEREDAGADADASEADAPAETDASAEADAPAEADVPAGMTPAEVIANQRGGTSFQSTIAEVSRDAAANITVPYYFICTLHLANEKGLFLSSTKELDDIVVTMPEKARSIAEVADFNHDHGGKKKKTTRKKTGAKGKK
jgi:condensin complex subunit 2